MKSNRFCIVTRSPLISLLFKGLVTKHAMPRVKSTTGSLSMIVQCNNLPLTWSVNLVTNAVAKPHSSPRVVPPILTTKNEAKPIRIWKSWLVNLFLIWIFHFNRNHNSKKKNNACINPLNSKSDQHLISLNTNTAESFHQDHENEGNSCQPKKLQL